MSVPLIGRARRLAMRRLRYILQDQFATEVAEEFAASDYPGLAHPVPRRDGYVLSEPYDPAEVARNEDITCYIWRTPSRRAIASYSSDSQHSTQWAEFNVTVLLLFRYAMGAKLTDEAGAPLPVMSEMNERSELYTSALIHTILKYGPSAGPIHKVAYLTDAAFAYLADEREGAGIIGVSSADFTIRQKVKLYERRPLPAAQ